MFSVRKVARLTGLEPATPGVTGRYSNRLSYNRASFADRCLRGVGGEIRCPAGRVKRFRDEFFDFFATRSDCCDTAASGPRAGMRRGVQGGRRLGDGG